MNDFKNKKVVIMGLGRYEDGSGILTALLICRIYNALKFDNKFPRS